MKSSIHRQPQNPRLISDKRGISPLIATILLLAFAVAVGTMVISLLIDASHTDVCSKVKIKIETAAHACYLNGRVSFILDNNGDTDITGAIVRFVTTNKDPVQQKLPLTLASAGASKIDVVYDTLFPEGVTVVIIPFIKAGSEDKPCIDQQLESTLGRC